MTTNFLTSKSVWYTCNVFIRDCINLLGLVSKIYLNNSLLSRNFRLSLRDSKMLVFAIEITASKLEVIPYECSNLESGVSLEKSCIAVLLD